jgi:hypothetical protein
MVHGFKHNGCYWILGFCCYANHFMKMYNYFVLGVALKRNHHFMRFLSDFCLMENKLCFVSMVSYFA